MTRSARFVLESHGSVMAAIGALVYASWTLMLASGAGIWIGPAAGFATGILVPALAIAALFAVEREASVIKAVQTYLAVRRASPSTRRRLVRRQADIADVLDQGRDWLGATRS